MDFVFADVSLRFLDYPDLEIDTNVMLDTLSSETASLTWEQNQQLFNSVMEDYNQLKTKKERVMKVKEKSLLQCPADKIQLRYYLP